MTKSEKTYLACPPIADATNNTGLIGPFEVDHHPRWHVVASCDAISNAISSGADYRTVGRHFDANQVFRTGDCRDRHTWANAGLGVVTGKSHEQIMQRLKSNRDSGALKDFTLDMKVDQGCGAVSRQCEQVTTQRLGAQSG